MKYFFAFISLFLLLVLCPAILYAQSVPKQIDSLMHVAESSNDSIKLRIYNKVSFYYIFNEPEKGKSLLLKGIALSKKKKNLFSESELVNTLGIYYDVSGKSDSAKYYFEKALQISEEQKFNTITVMVINNLGMFHWNKGNYQEALDYFFQALAMNKNNTVRKGDGIYLNNIGLIYQEMGQRDKALEYHTKALKIRRNNGQKADIAVSLNNIGINLTNKKNYEEAEKTFKEAISVADEANEMGIYYSSLGGLADLYILTGRNQLAIPLLEKVIAGRNKLNIERRANLSSISNLIVAYSRSNNLKLAKRNIENGNEFLDEFPDLRVSAIDFYRAASQTYFMDNNVKEGNSYFEKTLAAKDSIFSTENAEKTANLETKFKVAEKEKDLAEAHASLVDRELEVKQKNILIFGSLGLAIILGLIGFLFYNQQKLKNRQLQKEGELKTALAKIEIQNQLQEQRLRISRDLHDNIGSQLTFIISSIDNLKYGLEGVSSTISEKLERISEFTSHTIYELRDTIWAMNKNDISIEDLQARISNFIEKAKAATEVNFQFTVDEKLLEQTHFTSVQGMNVYRIIQEAVNNSLKYSEATKITVSIEKTSDGRFKIIIFDNGKGFDYNTITIGNGLTNIKKRAKNLDGEVEILSEMGNGTNITVLF